MSRRLIKLPHRALIKFNGEHATSFIQGLITNDINKLQSVNGIGAFILNTKGRIVEDVLLWRRGTDDIFMECSRENKHNLIKEISKYKLRKKVEISECNDNVMFLPSGNDIEFTDPRYSSFGGRAFGNSDNCSENVEEYENVRRNCGIAEGSAELGGLLPFQANGDLLNMVSLDKGCYIGQELTARTAHTGVIRRRILPCEIEGNVSVGSDILDEKNNKVGKVISSDQTRCLAVLQLSAFKTAKLSCDGIPLKAKQPEWMPDKILANNKARTSLTDS